METSRSIKYLGLSLLLIGGCLFSFEAAYGGDYFDALSKNSIANKNSSKQDIVLGFCDTMKKELDDDSKLAMQQSFFMASLCNNGTKDENEKFFTLTNEFIQDDFSFKKAKFQSSCREEYKDTCDVAELADNLLTEILSEMFTIRESTVFGIQGSYTDFNNGEKLKEWKNKFINDYLGIPTAEDYCKGSGNHKQTCKMIENQLKQFKKAFKNLQYLNLEKLYDNKNGDKCSTDAEYRKEHLSFCGLIGEIQGGLDLFADLVYNEIQRHSLFSSYYGYTLSQKETLTESVKKEYEKSFDGPQKFLDLTEETFIELNNIAVTYPLHVMLVAFQEDLLYVRDNYLVKIVTPFYCLYHKLRNVQFDK